MTEENSAIPLIGLRSPRPKCGKSTLAKLLESKGMKIIPFAETLKRMTVPFMEDLGYTPEEIEDLFQNGKDVPLRGLEDGPNGPVTLRKFWQRLGTEFGRELHPDIWTIIWNSKIKRCRNEVTGVVVDDLRFHNELALVGEMNGIAINIERTDAPPLQEAHASEGGLAEEDFLFTLQNDGPIEGLNYIADFLFEMAGRVATEADE